MNQRSLELHDVFWQALTMLFKGTFGQITRHYQGAKMGESSTSYTPTTCSIWTPVTEKKN